MPLVHTNLRFDRKAIMVEIHARVAKACFRARVRDYPVTKADMQRYLRFHARQVWQEAKHQKGLLISIATYSTDEERAAFSADCDFIRYADPVRDKAEIDAANARIDASAKARRERAIATLRSLP